MKSNKRRLPWAPVYALLLVFFTAFVLLDTFVIPRAYRTVAAAATAAITVDETADTSADQTASDTSAVQTADQTASAGDDATAAVVTDNSYSDGNITVTITTYREYDTDIYVADVVLSDPDYLKTALASDTYGKNITETTSCMASDNGAILAINGDYYGAQTSGYVIRNGVIYRDTVSGSSQEDLVIYADGTFGIIKEGDISASELLQNGAVQVLSFGPGLVENGEITVTASEEVDKAKTSNPRTAVGMIDETHYVFVVADGRTSASAGLSLYELAEFMKGLGVTTAYNLDGGGSSTMVFNGTVVNNPTTNGNTISERRVSDIVYIGY
jgi:exopolysaccharide biosynthesis protein